MYVPPLYRAPSAHHVNHVIRQNPLALLITNGPAVPYATHLPVVHETDGVDDIVGATLWGHLNRANPHWRAMAGTAGMAAKLVFSGPGTYVSPVNYGSAAPAAPTWDFVSVHLCGSLRPLAETDRVLAVVRRTALLLENAFGDGWDQSGSVEYFRSIVGGVGAFEFLVESVDAMFKLSQEKPAEIRDRLTERFRADHPGTSRASLGALMHDCAPVVPR